MTYRMISFGSIELDQYEEAEFMGTGESPSSYFNLPGGGSIDNFARKQTFPGSLQRQKSMVIAKKTGQNLQKYFNQANAIRGRVDKLYREDSDGNISWIWARLASVNIQRTTQENRSVGPYYTQAVSMNFVCEGDVWYGELQGTWQINDGNRINDNLKINSGLVYTIAAGGETITFDIDQVDTEGKTATSSIELTITPQTAAMTSISITDDQGATLTYTGTVAIGESLVINIGASTIRNDGDDAYADLAITYGTDPYAWMVFVVGENTIDINHNSAGDVDVSVKFTERWV